MSKNFNTKRRIKATKSIIHKLWKKHYSVIPKKSKDDVLTIFLNLNYWSQKEDELILKEANEKSIRKWIKKYLKR